MKRFLAGLITLVTCLVITSSVYAILVVGKGNWPRDWPKELDQFRNRSQTVAGPSLAHQVHKMPFASREEFETAWPHLMRVKTAGTAIVLKRQPMNVFGQKYGAGVRVLMDSHWRPSTEHSIEKGQWVAQVAIELYVDGQIIDLNRIPLPADTLIIDERFTSADKR